MRPHYVTDAFIQKFITDSLQEDVGRGDHSTLATIPAERVGKAVIIAKEAGILAGKELAPLIYRQVHADIKVRSNFRDGDAVAVGDVVFEITGPIGSILTGERLVLNCMQRMSGIATYTSKLAKMIAHTNAKLLDTRKTTPGIRALEKWAVKIGGGQNHRFGLYDMVMLKDNHIDFAGDIAQAIRVTNQYLADQQLNIPIEVEVRNLDEVQQVMEAGNIHRILLDNMGPKMLKEALKIIDNKYETEASGGINEQTIVQIAQTGVDFISVGALTHSYKSLDLSLKAKID